MELTAERWRHIIEARPYMAELQSEVLQTVSTPTEHLPGREQDEVWFYRRGVGPSAWLKVVVVFETDRAFVVTAFPRRNFP